MLDPKLVRERTEDVKQATRVKRVGSPELVDQWLAADERRRAAQTQADAVRAEQGKIGTEVGKLKRELKGGTNDALVKLIEDANALKARYDALIEQQKSAEVEAQQIMLQLPAIPDPTWPVGADAEENVVV